MSARFYLDSPHELEDYLTPVLLRYRDWWSQQVRAQQVTEGEIVLSGRVGSYYHKQLAQEAFRHVPNAQRVRNELQVIRHG